MTRTARPPTQLCFGLWRYVAQQVTVAGDGKARDLARLCIGITLMQRNGGKISLDFDGLERREDTVTADVPV